MSYIWIITANGTRADLWHYHGPTRQLDKDLTRLNESELRSHLQLVLNIEASPDRLPAELRYVSN